MRHVFRAVGKTVQHTPKRVLLLIAVIIGLAGASAATLALETSQEIFVEKSSDTYKDYKEYEKDFGGDQVLLIIPGSPEELIEADVLESMTEIQEVISAMGGVDSVISLVTFLQTGGPGMEITPEIAKRLVFTPNGEVNSNFAQIFVNDHTIMMIALTGGLSLDDQMLIASDIEDLLASSSLPEGTFAIGNPMLMRDMTTSMISDMATTGVIAVALMIVILYIVFPVRWRLIALPVVLAGVLVTFGIANLPGIKIPLTMVTMAGLPVLIGLGADFSIQFQNRYEEETKTGKRAREAIIDTITHIGPGTTIAVLATCVGFATLFLSKVPAVRDFGMLLIIGICCLFSSALFLLNSLLANRDKEEDQLPDFTTTTHPGIQTTIPERGTTVISHTAVRGIEPSPSLIQEQGEEENPPAGLAKILTTISNLAVKFGLPIVAIGGVLAVMGFAADGKLSVQTDIQALIPSDTPAVQGFDKARAILGSTDQLPLMIVTDNVTDPEILNWMQNFQNKVIEKHPEVVSANSFLSLVPGGNVPSPQELEMLLPMMPSEIRDSLITEDKTKASIIFALGKVTAKDIARILDDVMATADPPSGTRIAAGGAMTLMAKATSGFSEGRELQSILGLVGIFAVLLIVYRKARSAIVPLIPIALVTGWSSGIMYLLGMQLNPLTSMLGALIVGVGAEFAILLLERYNEERAQGSDPHTAMMQSVSTIGAAISASALTSIGGFGALMASSFPVLQSFGMLTVIDVSLALVATIVVVPPVAIWLDRPAKATADIRPHAAQVAEQILEKTMEILIVPVQQHPRAHAPQLALATPWAGQNFAPYPQPPNRTTSTWTSDTGLPSPQQNPALVSQSHFSSSQQNGHGQPPNRPATMQPYVGGTSRPAVQPGYHPSLPHQPAVQPNPQPSLPHQPAVQPNPQPSLPHQPAVQPNPHPSFPPQPAVQPNQQTSWDKPQTNSYQVPQSTPQPDQAQQQSNENWGEVGGHGPRPAKFATELSTHAGNTPKAMAFPDIPDNAADRNKYTNWNGQQEPR